MAAAFPFLADYEPEAGPLRTVTLLESAACWELDVSCARAAIASAAGMIDQADWPEAMLSSTRIIDVNQRAVHLVGPYSGRNRMIGQPITAFWPVESQPALAQLILQVIADFPCHMVRTRKVTSLQFGGPTLAVWTADGGERADTVFLAIQGTELDDRSLWLVRASEERYRNLIHHLPSALLQIDSRPMTAIFEQLRREGVTDIAAYLDTTPGLVSHSRDIVQVTDANHNVMQLLGADCVDQVIGSVGFLFAASPDTAKRVIAAHFNGWRNHAEVMKLRTFDGRLRDVQLSVTYPTPPERLDVTLISLEDITDRLCTEVQLRQLQADYARVARISMLGELATSIAHEVNQPLSAIVTNAETSLRWLSRDEPNLAKVGQLTARIADSARHASDIVQRIRGMAARRAPEQARLDLNQIVDEALLFVRHEIESRSIDLSVRLGQDLPSIVGDRVLLQQLVVNLLVNAVQAQAGEPHARIELSTATDSGNGVLFSIHDDGPGIAEEDLDRIFDTFFTTRDEGIGIGLALCQSIVAAHDGTITAANHPDGGALFRFSLPAVATA